MFMLFPQSFDRKSLRLTPRSPSSQRSRRREALRRRPLLDDLEGRQMLSSFTVDSNTILPRRAFAAHDHQSNSTTGTQRDRLRYPRQRQSRRSTSLGPAGAHAGDDRRPTRAAATTPEPRSRSTVRRPGRAHRPRRRRSAASGSNIAGLSITDFSGGGVQVDGASQRRDRQ